MSSSHEENWMVDVLFGILCVAVVVGAVAYLAYWILYGIAFGVCWIVPYLLFCVLPFGVMTAAYGFGLAGICKVDVETSEDSTPESNRPKYRFHRRNHYRRLAILFPVLVAATYGVFDLPQAHQVFTEKVVVEAARTERVNVEGEYDENGQPARPKYRKRSAVTRDEERTVYQWPELVNVFNQVNSAWQDVVPFLKQGKPYQVVLFDRNVWSLIAWICLLLSGPLLFWALAENALDSEDTDLSWWCEGAVNAEKSVWQGREVTWKKREAELLKYCEDWRAHSEAKKQEIAVLTAKLNFTPEGQQAKAEAKLEEEKQKPGVLDSDLL